MLGIIKTGEKIYRKLAERNGTEKSEAEFLLMDCLKPTMPTWQTLAVKAEGTADRTGDEKDGADSVTLIELTEEELLQMTGVEFVPIDQMPPEMTKAMYKHWNCICGIVPFITEEGTVTRLINVSAKINDTSVQTIRRYLYRYLIYQDIRCLSPKGKDNRSLTDDEKNYRWALNKFYYTKDKNSLYFAYVEMLRARYTDTDGKLSDGYPNFFKFRYFYRKTKDKKKEIISRQGMKEYQKNHRPLLGDGVQEFATNIGTGLLDSTICDLYLINERGEIVGRPILTACIDCYSGLCCGYSLGWEGGIYGIENLMENIITEKAEYCYRFGIKIIEGEWNCSELPTRFVTDKGREYAGENFEHMADLGIEIINLETYRPELKGPVEKFFDVVQDYFKPYLKGKGTIEPDFRQRGARDYRKDASLTMQEFETVLIRCIIFYNNSRVLENFPMTEAMLAEGVKPTSSAVWNYRKEKAEGKGADGGTGLIETDAERIHKILLPRTTGKFTRFGLKARKLRYKNWDYAEAFLNGKTVTVAYEKNDVSNVWVIENGEYVRFDLIEKRYEGKTMEEIEAMMERQKELIKEANQDRLQYRIELAEHLTAIRQMSGNGTVERNVRNCDRNSCLTMNEADAVVGPTGAGTSLGDAGKGFAGNNAGPAGTAGTTGTTTGNADSIKCRNTGLNPIKGIRNVRQRERNEDRERRGK